LKKTRRTRKWLKQRRRKRTAKEKKGRMYAH
jgi:hypothetical protein